MLSVFLPVPEVFRSRSTLRGFATATFVCLAAAGCASSGAMRRAHEAERLQDYDRAVIEYSKAIRIHPDDMDARLPEFPGRIRRDAWVVQARALHHSKYGESA